MTPEQLKLALTDWFDRLDFDRSNEATRHAEYAELLDIIRAIPPDARVQEALKTAIGHIEHMAAWITKQNDGYSFESLGEDMPGIKAALSHQPDMIREFSEQISPSPWRAEIRTAIFPLTHEQMHRARMLADRLRYINNERVISLALAEEVCVKLQAIIFFLDCCAGVNAQPIDSVAAGNTLGDRELWFADCILQALPKVALQLTKTAVTPENRGLPPSLALARELVRTIPGLRVV